MERDRDDGDHHGPVVCAECGAPVVDGAQFCGGCGAIVAEAGAADDRDRPSPAGGGAVETATVDDPAAPVATDGTVTPDGDAGTVVRREPGGRWLGGRWMAVAGLAAAVAVLATLAWPSPRAAPGPDDRTGVDTTTALGEDLQVRWDLALPGTGGPTGPGRPPVRLGDRAVAVGDVVVDADGVVTAARPPGLISDGRWWARAGSVGLVVGDVVTGRIDGVRPWPGSLAVTPVGSALAWADDDGATGGTTGDRLVGHPVLEIAEGGAVRLGADLTPRWRSDAVPVLDDPSVTSDGGPLVPARVPGTAAVDQVLDLRDGRVVARLGDGLRLLAVGDGLAVTADERDVVAAWSVAGAGDAVVLPGGATPVWEQSVSPGRPVGVDVLAAGRLAVHAQDAVVGEVRLVDARTGTVLDVVAGWPNSDLDGGRTAEAFDEVVAGVVGDELRRFAWDGTPLQPVALGSEGWFVVRGGDLVQLVARRSGAVRLVTAGGEDAPVEAPPPTAPRPDRLVGAPGGLVGIGGSEQPRWVDARTGELDVRPPVGGDVSPGGAATGSTLLAVGEVAIVRGGAVGAGLQLQGADGSAIARLPAAVGVAGPVGEAVVVIEPGAVALIARDGSQRWRTDLLAAPALASLEPGVHPGLVVTPSHVVVPLGDGTVVGLARDDGRTDWSVRTGLVTDVVGAGAEVVLATATGAVLRLGPDGERTGEVLLEQAAVELAVAADVVVALAPERLVGIAPPGGPVPDEDRVELSSSRSSSPSRTATHAASPTRWHAGGPRPALPGG